ncbi:MAG TPA: MFS transporter, partial [Stenotrophomonas sp.]|nr:MFS transporter [Stenotrophomonas sp.]
ALMSLTAFLWIEAHSTSPMLPLNLFRNHTFSIVSLAGVAVNFAYYGLIFVFSLFFQMQQHLSPQQTGLAFLPMTLVLVALNVVAGRLITRLGPRLLMFMGLALAGSGYLLLMRVSIGGHYALLIVPMLMAASGVALVVPTMTNATLASVDRSRAGIASSVLNCARQVGGMLGVALFGSLIGDGAPDAFMHGMHISIGMSAGALLLASVLCWSGMRPGPLHPLRASGEAVKPE